MKSILLIYLVFIGSCSLAQKDNSSIVVDTAEPDSLHREEQSRPVFIPGVSSVLLHPGQVEVNSFNSFGFADRIYNGVFPYNQLDGNSRYVHNSLQFTYGITKSQKLNIGFDLINTFSTFNLRYNGLQYRSQYNLTAISPRVRWSPFNLPKFMGLTIQHYVVLPIYRNSSMLSRAPYFGNQFIFTQRLSYKFMLMEQVDITIFPKYTGDNKHSVTLPATVFLGYIFNSKFLIFGFINYTPELGSSSASPDDGYYLRRYTLLTAAGVQGSLSSKLQINAFYSMPIATRRQMEASSISLGARLLIN